MNSFFPPFPGLAYERMFTKLVPTARLKPLSAYLALTQDCPANCWKRERCLAPMPQVFGQAGKKTIPRRTFALHSSRKFA